MTNPVYRRLIAASVALAACCSGCSFSMTSFNYTGVTAETSDEGSFGDGIDRVQIVNEFGDVTIDLADGEPRWTWNSKVWADTQELADQYLAALTMDVQIVGSQQTWTLVMPEPHPDLNGVESNLTLHLPANVAVTLENRHGNVDASGVRSDIDLSNAHGDLKANQFHNGVFDVRHGSMTIQSGNNVQIESAHGSATVRQIAGDLSIGSRHGKLFIAGAAGPTEIENQHGGITATGLSGDTTVNAQHGSVSIETACNNVTINSAHGNVRLTTTSELFENISITNRHGNIDLALPDSVQAAISMEATHGHTSSEITSTESSRQVQLNNAHGNIRVTKSGVAVTAEAIDE